MSLQNQDWNTVWVQLKNIMVESGSIYTLTHNKENKIVEITNKFIEVKTDVKTAKKPAKIKLDTLKKSWKHLVNDGVLVQKEYRKSSYRSAFVVTLFSLLDCVEILSKDSVIIKLKE